MSALDNARAPRFFLFALASAALVLGAVLFAGSSGSADPEIGASTPPPGTRDAMPAPLLRALAGAHRREAALRRVGSRFLSAFLRYEVGEATSVVEARLRSTSGPLFAGQLLAHPPRPPSTGIPPHPARLHRIHVAFLAGPGERAVISGTARRGSASEEFSFVFARPGGRWLAVGAGE